ncbi:Os07g0209201 [Oryza sativa Japonica Group]|uniref:Os07g0209201 protein n=1 Tax=Oryza sativa subsp. japonica TaxID=39947 RepID=A0A0P0X4H1_ORYSJ|nr:hypothetical protein EE612_037808 [Oryza sativa]BAT00581.1 Os07g0209201 [Oryza sativa Japonica Group]
MEHVPVGLHELAEEDGVVGDGGDVDGVGRRVARVEVVGGADDGGLARAVEHVGVVAHAGDAAVVREAPRHGRLERAVVGARERDAAAVAGAERLDDVLHVHLHAVDAARRQVGVELVVEVEHLARVDEAQAEHGEGVHDDVRLVRRHPRRLHRVRQRRLVPLHRRRRRHAAPVPGHGVPHVHLPDAVLPLHLLHQHPQPRRVLAGAAVLALELDVLLDAGEPAGELGALLDGDGGVFVRVVVLGADLLPAVVDDEEARRRAAIGEAAEALLDAVGGDVGVERVPCAPPEPIQEGRHLITFFLSLWWNVCIRFSTALHHFQISNIRIRIYRRVRCVNFI